MKTHSVHWTNANLRRQKHAGAVHVSTNSSTKSGVTPSVPAQVSSREETNEEAKAFPQEMANILVHLRCQAKCADRRKMAGVSRAFAAAKASTNLKASSLQRPPVSTPTTTRWQRSPFSNSANFLSLSRLALTNTAPSTCAAFPEGRPAPESADRSVMSTACWAPWCKGRPDATTSMARWSVVWTATFMSCSRQLSNDGSCFSAHSCHGAFCWQGSGTQPSGPRARLLCADRACPTGTRTHNEIP